MKETAVRKNSAIPWWGYIAFIAVVVLGVVAYAHLPAQIVGKGNHRAPRLLAVAYEPGVMLVIILLWHVLWKIDPKKRNYASFWPTYRYVGGVVVVAIGLVYLAVLGHLFHIATMRIIPTVLGIMFMLIANVLPRLQPNWWLGVRTPWTLSSAESWRRSHRLAGQLGVPVGLLIIILGWVLPAKPMMKFAIVAPMLIWVAITVVASYFYAQHDSKAE